MSKAKQKQLENLREQKQNRQNEYKLALKRLIENDQSLRISLNFAEQYLNSPIDQPLQQYSATSISRLIFQKQLAFIRAEFQKLPNHQCKIEHFVIILLKALKFSFEKTPLFMVGLKDMYYEIIEEGKQTINYDNIFKYIVGQVVTLKQEEQNTQFQVHFQENKKQDFLLHDQGIKRIVYSFDLKIVMSLDEKDNTIKFYDRDMKNINKYSAKKELHYGKIPIITDFDYSEMTMRLGVIFPNKIIESIHLPNYLTKTQTQFESTTLNQLLFTMPQKMRKIIFIQMLNKWLTISEEDNRVYLFDMQKVRLKPEQVMQRMHIDNNDLNFSMVLQIVALSTICFVAGNQISFYNESLVDKKCAKFQHHEIITIFKFCQQNNTFYIAGKQKTITIFTINRNRISFKISTLQINKIITDFELFPFYDAILVCDDSHDIRLMNLSSKNIQQQQSLQNIVKMKDQFLKLHKISKTQFMVYQTYMLMFDMEKVAIQKEMEFNFLPYFYFDNKKQQFYLSVNNQIMSISVIFGEIRKNYSQDTSNIVKHDCFFLGNKTNLFIFDSNKYLYQIYMKTQQIQGQNKNYRKKVPIKQVLSYHYDQEMRAVMLVSNNSIHIIRNDFGNNFNSINTIHLVDISNIANCTFCPKSKYLTFITQNHLIYQLFNFQSHISKCFKFKFLKPPNEAEQKIIIQYEYCSHYQILILLNNQNELVIVQRLNIQNYAIVKITDYLPYKLKGINFSKFSYHFIKDKNINYSSVIFYDQSGYIFDLNLQKIIISKFINTKKEEFIIKSFLKQPYEIKSDYIVQEEMQFRLQNKSKINPGEYFFQKIHEKQVVIGTKLLLQILTTLTISKDSFIKLWNQKYVCLYVLKIPTLFKMVWNMKQIQSIKNQKSITEVKQIISLHYSQKNNHKTPIQTINKNKKIKHYVEPKTTKFNEIMPLQIQSKEIEDIVMKQEDYRKGTNFRGIKSKFRFNPEMSLTSDNHPWRHRNQFVKILEKASPPHKYSAKIPGDLVTLRTSLDMSERKKKTPNYKIAELILPQLKLYQNQKTIDTKVETKRNEDKEEVQNFESCLYIKTERKRKKGNEFDEIDRQFFKKEIDMQHKRWVPKFNRQKVNSTIDITENLNMSVDESRYDTMKNVESVFQQHNRECTEKRRGRIIHIPRFKLIKDYL